MVPLPHKKPTLPPGCKAHTRRAPRSGAAFVAVVITLSRQAGSAEDAARIVREWAAAVEVCDNGEKLKALISPAQAEQMGIEVVPPPTRAVVTFLNEAQP